MTAGPGRNVEEPLYRRHPACRAAGTARRGAASGQPPAAVLERGGGDVATVGLRRHLGRAGVAFWRLPFGPPPRLHSWSDSPDRAWVDGRLHRAGETGGTLGLLFLTPLRAGGIVAGKALVGALRAFTLWLAVLPILIIPFIGGGITRLDALSALSLEFCATVLCLAAGLLASSLARERNTAFVLAYVSDRASCYLFSLLFALVVVIAHDLRRSTLLLIGRIGGG